MWRLVWFFAGWCRIRVTGASPQWILGAMAKRRVAFRDFRKTDDFTAEMVILRHDLPLAHAAARKAMCELELLRCGGFATLFEGLRKRPFFPAALLLAVLAATACTRFVWFYDVEGNDRVPAQKILRELQQLGVGFGTFGPSIQPQRLKNHMLCRIPELQGLTVTQNGGCAVVTVRERPVEEAVADRKTAQNVLAARGGVLTRVSVLEGSCLCKIGDVVQEGQLLVSAYTDWGYKTQVSGALAEIYAATSRRACTVLPEKVLRKSPNGQTRRSVSLVLGRKRWKLFGNSGFSDETCDKMTTTYPLTLPGGYSLPAALEITVRSDYDTEEASLDAETVQQVLEEMTLKRAKAEMIAGTVEEASFSMKHENGAFRLYASLRCEEMIARMVRADIFKDDANADY